MINMKLPGAEAHVFAYDSEGRQVFSRDGNQYGRDRRAFALYDALGRVAVTGTCQDAADEAWWSQPSSSRPAMTARRSGAASAVNRWGVACGYDWDVPMQDIEILTVSYYDDYGFATDNSAMITLPQGAKASPKGLATGTLTALLGNGGGRATSGDGISGYLLSTNFYDTEERLIETRTQTPGGGQLTATTAYTAGGVPVQTRTRLAHGDSLLTYTNDITVDRHGRPVTSVLTRGDSGPSWTLAACTYDGIGRLSSVTAGGTLTRTLSYDIHGWQTGWETPYLSEKLYYGESGPSGTTPSYTGLITAKKMYTAGGRLKSPDTYSYSYDRLGRLTAAKYSAANVLINFSTTYAYDLQGNMLRMTRMGLTAPGRYGEVDNVTATYTGNQLHTLRDDAPEVLLEASMDVASGTYSSGSFAYDANGNMILDLSRDITDQEYNALNLPQRITFADGSYIDGLYTASGQKLRQTVIAASGDTIARRDYLGPYLFVNNKLDRYETAEGYITPDDDFHAYIPDYQGNIVGVYNTSPNSITSIGSPLDQHTRYYPYGLPFADSGNPTVNRRKYGAKELTPDLGLNAYDFKARTLAPAFPAFAQPDPLTESYYPLSPYLYCAGNPVNLVDPNGMEGIRYENDKGEKVIECNVVVLVEEKKPIPDTATPKERAKLERKNEKIERKNQSLVEDVQNNLNKVYGNAKNTEGETVHFIFNVMQYETPEPKLKKTNRAVLIGYEFGLEAIMRPGNDHPGLPRALAAVVSQAVPNNVRDLGTASGNLIRMQYMDAIILSHEMGHVLGLEDCYKERVHTGGLMDYPPGGLLPSEVDAIWKNALPKQ
ncbi:MAG: RHS repeat domain-containing protein [Muribaculaceae bacterium]